MRRFLAALGGIGLLGVTRAATLMAHDCVGGVDCIETAGYNAVVSVVGGLLAGGAAAIGGTLGTEALIDMTTSVDDIMGTPDTGSASTDAPADGTSPRSPDDGSDLPGARSDQPPDNS